MVTKQKKAVEKFLESYRKLEGVITEVEHCSVFDYESRLQPDSEEASRLKMTRLTRNFLVHNSNDGFICVSDAMLSFVSEEIEKEVRKYKTAGEAAKKIRPVKNTDSLQSCVSRLAKIPFIPVVDKEHAVVGCITAESVCQAYSRATLGVNTKVSVAIERCAIHASDEPAKDINTDAIIVDGKAKKYVGILVMPATCEKL